MLSITINGQRLAASEGETILQVARRAGITIPTLCDHPHLTPFGGCRLCIVEVEGPGLARTILPLASRRPPSETMEFYRETPQRRRAMNAPPGPNLLTATRPPDPPLPIDDSDGGCDSGQKPWYRAWTRQHSALKIADADAVSDSGDDLSPK